MLSTDPKLLKRSRRFPGMRVLALVCLAVLVLLAFFPREGIEAAVKGVGIWWDVLFPALLPFCVIAEVLLGFGIVHFFGTLLDPLMRPLFGVPGIGGFVMAMGFASGYPIGARLTSQLWEQKLVNREEGERLVSFTTTSDPIFLIGAVSVGFFHNPGLAPVLAAAHYGGAVLVGLFMRFIGERTASRPAVVKGEGSLLARSFRAMHEARLADGRPFGTLFRQAVDNSLRLIFVIGGLVVFFSVVIELLSKAHVMSVLHEAVQLVMRLFAIPPDLSHAVVSGLFEVTLGAKAAGEADGTIPLVSKTAIAALVLSWGGLSVHAQIVSILHHTNLRYAPFLLARALHSLAAALLVFLLWKPLAPLQTAAAAFFPPSWGVRPSLVPGRLLPYSLLAACLLIAALVAAAPLFRLIVHLLARRGNTGKP
jgi:sporulation integral membrane protein YlbJ